MKAPSPTASDASKANAMPEERRPSPGDASPVDLSALVLGSREKANTPTLADVRGWPATVDVVTAGRPFGLGRAASYDLARRGEFPVPVLRLGHRLRVVTTDVLRALGG